MAATASQTSTMTGRDLQTTETFPRVHVSRADTRKVGRCKPQGDIPTLERRGCGSAGECAVRKRAGVTLQCRCCIPCVIGTEVRPDPGTAERFDCTSYGIRMEGMVVAGTVERGGIATFDARRASYTSFANTAVTSGGGNLLHL